MKADSEIKRNRSEVSVGPFAVGWSELKEVLDYC
jgi:hypothetical protein